MPLLTRKRRPRNTYTNLVNSTQYDSDHTKEDVLVKESTTRESIENDNADQTTLNKTVNKNLESQNPLSLSNSVNILNSNTNQTDDFTSNMSSKRECPFEPQDDSKRRKGKRSKHQSERVQNSVQSSQEVLETVLSQQSFHNNNHTTSYLKKNNSITTTIENSEHHSQNFNKEQELDLIQPSEGDNFENNDCDVSLTEEMEINDFGSQIAGSQVLDSTKSQMNNFLRNVAQTETDRAKNINGELGHIQEIRLQNFMCHSHFHLELGPRINFILGPNGSGKSAILNGIVLGLGGRASNTNRGSGLASFIKTGQNKAKVVIKLCNYCENNTNSYLPQKYGKSITIERTIYANGSSSYKILSENGKVVSEKKDELESILKHFSILVDNPICLLSQEVSKNFLNTKSALDKYKFFIKATQLEDVKMDYETSYIKKENSHKLLNEKSEVVKTMEKELKEYEKKVEIIEMLKNSVEKIHGLNCEALWANLKENQVEIDKLSEKVQEIDKKFDLHSKKIETADQSISELNNKKEQFVDKLKNLASVIENANMDHNQAAQEAKNVRKDLTEKENSLRIVKNELNVHIREINDLKKRIEGIESKNEEEDTVDLETQIENVQTSIQEKKVEERELQEKFHTIQQQNEEQIGNKLKLDQEERKIMAEIKSHNSELERISKSQKNRINRYGQKYAELLEQINAAVKFGRFKKRPLGPIGEYIHLEDASCALAVECCLKTFLFAFVVDNLEDSRVLKSILNRLFVNIKQPNIIIRKFTQLHDVSENEAYSPKFKNFLQILNISEPAVANCLIDHLKIEQILYIPSFKEAQHLLINSRTVPRNCLHAYTSNGDLMYPSSSRSDYKCYPNKRLKIAKILVKDFKSTEINYKKMIEELNRKHNSNRENFAEITKSIEANKREINEINEQISTIKMDIMKFEKQFRSLKAKTNIKPVEVIALKEEISKLETERKNLDDQVQSLTNERNQLSEKYTQFEMDVDQKYRSYQEIVNSRQPIKDQIESIQKEISTLSNSLTVFNKQKEETLKNKSALETKLRQQQQEMERNRESALQETNGKPIETSRKCEEIMSDIKRIELIIRDNCDMTNAKQQESIIQRFNQLSQQVNILNLDLNQLKSYIELLANSLRERKFAYFKLRHYITMITNYYFEEILSQKGFTGEIEVNFNDVIDSNGKKERKAKTLEIRIRPRDEEQFFSQGGSQAEQIRPIYSSTKSLSGGERSYSTVAFIIALWEICSSPFKVLDEVDVFMDMITRKISIDTLIEFASFKSSKQYIFLSPLQIPQIHRPECIKIFQMPEIIRT